jgi:predicted DNA-binding protein (MmcQ/YjbR family)
MVSRRGKDGKYLVDIPFPTKVRDQVIAAGRAEPHHLLADSGWVSFYIRAEEDVERATSLLQESYALAAKQKAARSGQK